MSLEDRGVITLWEGEWPWLRRSVSMAREWGCLTVSPIFSVLDFATYLATANMYAAQADHFVTTSTLLASEQLRTRRWILPATGIAATSMFVVVKSSPWGTYKALRNGVGAAVLLTGFLFPREIIEEIDAILPFGFSKTKKQDTK